ncbi:MAG: efflux RND transporter periplasmic adaptor subunit [Planctomycetes bacterium]|nr:efflux RND transporter periplasmic adaptor subunit [Planctomycetota bacterium]
MPPPRTFSTTFKLVASALLLAVVAATALGLYLWKGSHNAALAAAAAGQPERSETVDAALVRTQQWARSTTSIGTAHALQSITLRNELPGTVHSVKLQTGQVVEAGDLLVELDVSVEQAELAALEAEARLAESMLGRMEKALKDQGASAADVDRARAEHDKALANVKRTEALIERKRVRAPFRARVGLLDLHLGQYLDAGTTITTLQGVDEAMHIDFAVTQDTAARLQIGGAVAIGFTGQTIPVPAKIIAIDARVDSATRNTWIRALLDSKGPKPQPGSSVRVRTPVEAEHEVLVVPASALRRGPGGDLVYVLQTGVDGMTRAASRRVISGVSLADDVVILEGLKAGEQVGTTGSFKLREGVLVNIKNAPAKGQ